ncbi:hypothetical protein SSCG_02634 [Streptomyces clavuligerus]|nr:hypothetical protein SSCG_02634 [Streptomyces clavuligerus]
MRHDAHDPRDHHCGRQEEHQNHETCHIAPTIFLFPRSEIPAPSRDLLLCACLSLSIPGRFSLPAPACRC